MRRLIILFLLVLMLAVFIPFGEAQNESCEVDLSDAMELLKQSQAQADSGDMAGALATLEDAQASLRTVADACRPTAKGLIAIKANEGTSGFSITTSFDDLDALSFMNYLELSFNYDPKDADVVAVVYGEGSPREGDLQQLLDFAQRGGRVLILYDNAYTNVNDFLRENLNLMVVEETILSVGKDDLLVYPEGALPQALHGYKVGVTSSSGMRLGAYILARTPGAEEGYVTSEETGEERLMLYTTPDGRITFMPRTYFEFGSYHDKARRYFFEDRHLGDSPDNEAAILALLNYLLSS